MGRTLGEQNCNKLDDLYDKADREGVPIVYCPLKGMRSMIGKAGNTVGIGISTASCMTRSEETACMAHELGHYYTGTYYKFSSPLQLRSQMEYRADAWMICDLVPIDELRAAFMDGYTEIWNLSGYFGVPEKVIFRAVEIYRDKGLL